MRKRKGNLLQRTMASLLSAVLIMGMALDAVPLTVLAQENVGGGYNATEESVIGNTVTAEATESESGEKESIPESREGTQEFDGEETAADSAAEKAEDTEELKETQKPVENPAAEKQDGVSEQEPAAEDEEAGIIDSNGVQPDELVELQKAVSAADAAAQAGNVTPIKGTGWAIDSTGKLTIESDEGMKDWDRVNMSYCRRVYSIEINANNSITSIINRAFYNCINLTSITIPDSVTNIENEAFADCVALASITIPDNVTNIGESVFKGCYRLREVTLPSGMESIGNRMFESCEALEDIIIPSGVRSIGASAFQDCFELKGITIPSGVTSIGSEAFEECSMLETVTMQSNTPPTLEKSSREIKNQFTRCKFVTDNKKGIKVPEGTADAYKAAWPEWKDYITDGTDDEEGSAPVTPADKVEAAKKAVEKALADITVSNATTQESLAQVITEAVNTALEEAGIDSKDVTVAVEDFLKTEATTETAGSITANIKITSGTESASVPVDKGIDRLPVTPADKVEAAKKAVEKALADITVS
ncbi:MAG: leucine-rich repeat protein, partial [Lachnospiraceae bacterium]|nr:leucine-rich repeat protein [Lachnospiraceae bacterium]